MTEMKNHIGVLVHKTDSYDVKILELERQLPRVIQEIATVKSEL